MWFLYLYDMFIYGFIQELYIRVILCEVIPLLKGGVWDMQSDCIFLNNSTHNDLCIVLELHVDWSMGSCGSRSYKKKFITTSFTAWSWKYGMLSDGLLIIHLSISCCKGWIWIFWPRIITGFLHLRMGIGLVKMAPKAEIWNLWKLILQLIPIITYITLTCRSPVSISQLGSCNLLLWWWTKAVRSP